MMDPQKMRATRAAIKRSIRFLSRSLDISVVQFVFELTGLIH